MAPNDKNTKKTPKQARSRDTERRLIEAAARIVESEGLGALSVAKVVRAAKSSVGSFYARFDDKDDLLRAVHAARMRTRLDELEALAETGALADTEGRVLVSLCMEQIVAHYREQPRLMAAFHARSSADPERWRAAVLDHRRLSDALVRILLQGRWEGASELDHPEPERAFELALLLVFSFIGDLAVHDESIPPPFPLDALVAELTRVVVRYVTRPGAVR
ncbi:MAG: TetR family transcriptional regulator [Sandaracinaceae bacterium]